MTQFIVFRVSSDQWRAMPTSTIQSSPLSAHPTHPTQSQLPDSHLKTPQLQPIHQPQPLLKTALHRSPHLHQTPPFYQFTSRTRREARNTPLTHAPYSNIEVLRTDGWCWCCFYRSKTTSAKFLRSGWLRSTLHRLVGNIRYDSARSWLFATSLSTLLFPSPPSALFLP